MKETIFTEAEQAAILEAWGNNTKKGIIAMFPKFPYSTIANFVSRHNRHVRQGKKAGAVFLKPASIRSAAKAVFTPEEITKLLEIFPTATKPEVLAAFPGRTIQQVRDHISKRNNLIRAGKMKGKIIHRLFKSDLEIAERENEAGWQEHEIPLLGKDIITENLYSFRLGYELRGETYGNGRGVIQSQPINLKAA